MARAVTGAAAAAGAAAVTGAGCTGARRRERVTRVCLAYYVTVVRGYDYLNRA